MKERERLHCCVNRLSVIFFVSALLETLALPAMVVPVDFPTEEPEPEGNIVSRDGSQDLLVTQERRLSVNGRLLNNGVGGMEDCACSRLEKIYNTKQLIFIPLLSSLGCRLIRSLDRGLVVIASL